MLSSKAMMPMFRLPLSLSFFFSSLLEFWLYRPFNYDNYFYFSSMCMISFADEFCTVYVCLVCMSCILPLSMQCFVTCGSMNRPS